MLPQTQPPSLRILPARFYVRKAKFRFPVYEASGKSGTLHTSDIGHWFAIDTTFLASLLLTNVRSQKRKKSLFRASAHTGVGTPKVLGYFVERKTKRYDINIDCVSPLVSDCIALAPTPLVLRPGRILKGGRCVAQRIRINDCRWQSLL